MLSRNSKEPQLGPQASEMLDRTLRRYLDSVITVSKSRGESHLEIIASDDPSDREIQEIGADDPYIFEGHPDGYEEWKPKVEERVRGRFKTAATHAALSPRTYISNAILVEYGPHFSDFLNQGQYEWIPVNHGVSSDVYLFEDTYGTDTP